MGDVSTIEIKADSSGLTGALNNAFNVFKGFGQKVMGVAGMLIPAFSFGSIIGNIVEGMGDFAGTDKGIAQLNTQLKATEGIAGFTLEDLEQINENLQGMSKHGDDAIRSAQAALLKFQNVRGDVFKDALKGALDLSAATGDDLTAATEKLGKALNDPLRGLKALRSEGVVFSKEQKTAIEAMIKTGNVAGVQNLMLEALATTFGGSAKSEAATFSGQMAKLGEVIGDAWKAIGGLLVPVLQKFIPIAQTAGNVVIWLTGFAVDLFNSIAEYAEAGISVGIEWLKSLLDAGVVTFTFLQTIITNWGDYTKGTLLSLQATSVKVFAVMLEYVTGWAQGAIDAFTQLINFGVSVFEHLGKLGQWFYESQITFWTNMWEAFKSILSNMYDNFAGFVKGLADLASGKGMTWSWKSMTESFKEEFKALPQFAHTEIGRVFDIKDATGVGSLIDDMNVGATELQASADVALSKFGQGFTENLEKNRATVDEFIKSGLDAISGEEKDVNADTDKMKGEFVLPTEPKDEKEDSTKMGEFEDLLALNKRITAGAAKSPEQKELERGNDIARQQLEAIKGLRQDWKNQNSDDADAPTQATYAP